MPKQPQVIDPEQQGLASGLLDGAMRTGSVPELMDRVGLLLEQNVPNLEILYELAQEDHPSMPTWEELMDQMDEVEPDL
jgi:hypothetical protein